MRGRLAGGVYGDLVLAHLAEVGARNAEALAQVAGMMLAGIRAGGLMLTAGAGHSLAAVAETFFRAGGLACVRPLHTDRLQVFGGARRATAAEREPGVAAAVFGEVSLSGNDILFVFSTSGINHYPVELAVTARAAGVPVVAVTSRATSAAATPRAGTRLYEHATVVLDTRTGPGDVAYPPAAPATASLSTLSNAYLWNQLLAHLHDLAEAEGVTLPRWQSSNTEGGDEANAQYLDVYGPRVPHLGA
ncbi:sugar isomerase domain-containing protein [Actinokineospora pegani]|uniref:sugar isomerase domain-containing protein n=1 Tax=Actinokineospora pegani TaxID=2654637 RepID=UPI001F3DD70A|nr:sugar isomerase domain-containing protein [Actinokineospora pegani]